MTLRDYYRGFVFAAFLAFCIGMPKGPCDKLKLKTYEIDPKKWAGDFYVNIETKSDGRCRWVSRRIGFEDKAVTFRNFIRKEESGKDVELEFEGIHVGKGHFKFFEELSPGKLTEFHAYVLLHDPPNLQCQLVCSDDPTYKDTHYKFYCEGQHPDAKKKYAKKIKKIAEKNEIDLNSLMIVDNCKCPNIPYLHGKSACKKVTVEEYFGLKTNP